MSLLSAHCPVCGIKFNARSSSIGTLRRCQNCGHKFILQAPPVSIIGLVVLALFVVIIVVSVINSGGSRRPVVDRDLSTPGSTDAPPVPSLPTGKQLPAQSAPVELMSSSPATAAIATAATLPVQSPYPPENPGEDLKLAAGKKLEEIDPEYRVLKAYLPIAKIMVSNAHQGNDAAEQVKAEADLAKTLLRIDDLQRAMIKRDPTIASARLPLPANANLPSSDQVSSMLSQEPWLSGLDQIPATVIDKGVMKYVPYRSFRSGDFELNVYGNPDSPAAIEIGVYPPSASDATAKEKCLRFISRVLGPGREATCSNLNRTKDSIVHGDLTYEVTPTTDEDAFGAWWVSVYSVKDLDAARASADELRTIAVPRVIVATPPPPAPKASAFASSAATTPAEAHEANDWSPSDMARSRATAGGGGSVYVRGYTRKDGTYVHSYTRSAPGSGSHGGGGRR